MIDRFLNHCCRVVTNSTNSGPNRGFGKPNRTDPNSEPNRGYFKNRTEFRTEPEKVIPHTPTVDVMQPLFYWLSVTIASECLV